MGCLVEITTQIKFIRFAVLKVEMLLSEWDGCNQCIHEVSEDL